MSAVFVGGNWTNGRNCSPVYFNLNNAPSNSNINRLARLCCSIKSLVLRALFLAPWQKLLHKQVALITDLLAKDGIRIKDNWQVYRFDYIDRHGKRRGRDLDFLGLRFFRDKTILRKWLSLKISRQSRKLGKQEIISARNARSFMARIGWLRHCNSYNYYHKNIRPNVKIKKIKDVIRNEDRKQRDATAPL